MFRAFIAFSIITLFAAAALSPANATEPTPQEPARPLCAPMPVLAQFLRERHGEAVVGAGLQGGQALVTVFASPETGSWTLVVSRPDGRACAVAAGQAWQSNPEFVSGTPS